MRRIYLHIGRGKTGTTSIQSYLAKNRKVLLRYGVDYLLVDDKGRGMGHQQFAKSFVHEMPEYMVPAVRPITVRKKISRAILNSKAQTIIISSENFTLADKADLLKYFEDLQEPFTIKIILFVRSQDELAESEYNQIVKLRNETCSFATYADEKIEDLDYLKLAEGWENVFGKGNVLCKVYDGKNFNALEQFLSVFSELVDYQIALPEIKKKYIQNRSLGFKALIALRILNALKLKKRDKLYANIINELSSDDLPALFFDSKSAKEYRDRFATSNRAFCIRYLAKDSYDIGGRRYSDHQRDEIYDAIGKLRLSQY